ncbi:MAG: adenosine deaminase family protein [Acidimicrobiia bacterium]|nr:adenosine deaminase family protein [Acidimicrobiia bacterium]
MELHVHLEGTITAATALELARRHAVDGSAIAGLVDGGYPGRFRDFAHFVELYVAVSSLIRTPADLEAVAAGFVRQQADQGILHTEATFTATTHVANGMDPHRMWRALRDGFATEPRTSVGLIVDAVRDLGAENARRTIELVADADAPIVALGLAGIETARPIEEFSMLREAADDLGIGLVVHAGETGPPSEVAGALDLGVDRVAHGISAVRDPAVLARIVDEGVPIDVCPTSNVVLGVVADYDDHPLAELWASGARLTIGSDDPPFFGTTLVAELQHAVRMAGLGPGGLERLQRTAVDASFLGSAERRAIHGRIDAWAATHAP